MEAALLRIHDLVEANTEQENFYRSLISQCRSHLDDLSPNPSRSDSSEDRPSLRQLESSLQTAREDIEVLQKANGALFSPL